MMTEQPKGDGGSGGIKVSLGQLIAGAVVQSVQHVDLARHRAGPGTLGPAVADQLANSDNRSVSCTRSYRRSRFEGERDIAHGKGLMAVPVIRHGGPPDLLISRSGGNTFARALVSNLSTSEYHGLLPNALTVVPPPRIDDRVGVLFYVIDLDSERRRLEVKARLVCQNWNDFWGWVRFRGVILRVVQDERHWAGQIQGDQDAILAEEGVGLNFS